jgi:hypothetical protein
MPEINTTVEFFADGKLDITFLKVDVDDIDKLFDYLGTTEGRNDFAASLEASLEAQGLLLPEGETK